MAISGITEKINSLVITDVENIQSTSNSVLKQFSKKSVPGAYVCLNRPQHAVKNILRKENIDFKNILFIDCISSALISVAEEENVTHISNPADLTGLSIAISEFIKSVNHDKFIMIDALGTLLIYNHEEIVLKFIRCVLEECSETDCTAIMITPKTEDSSWINRIIPFFDNIVHL
ncbi:MAG: ATPase domain-containing protein [Nanoarchaeota archaeon]|nr:ATPase domain-containing protein [Nanoarchaeota archaeon]